MLIHFKGPHREFVVGPLGFHLEGGRPLDLFLKYRYGRFDHGIKVLFHPQGWGKVLDPKDLLEPLHDWFGVGPI